MKALTRDMIEIFDAATSPPIAELPPLIMRAIDEKGVVVVRGYKQDLQQFETLTKALCYKFHNAGSRYKNIQSGGDSLSTASAKTNYTLLAHSEGVYNPQEGGRPDIAFFMCGVAPIYPGGETTVIDGAAFYDAMPAEWRAKFATGLTYTMQWDKIRWQPEFQVDNIPDLKAHLAQFPNVEYHLEGEVLHLKHHTSGITRCRSGRPVFAPGMLTHLPRLTHPNYQDKVVHTKPTNVMYFGDGEELSSELINGLVSIHDALLYPHVWQKDDIIILDNTRYLHGRTMTEKDCERVIITRFGWIPTE
jgi:alpha-ketoglutarate-dependent taurine dioxygenase